MTTPTGCTLVRVFKGGHTDVLQHATLSPDGTRLASRSADGRVVVWDVATGQCLWVYSNLPALFMTMMFSPSGDRLAYGDGRSEFVRVHHIESGQVVMDMPLDSYIWCATWTPDGMGLVYGYTDGTVQRWAVAANECVWQTQHHTINAYCVAMAPDGQTGASGSWDRTVRLWRADDGQLLRTIQTECTACCLAFAPDGQRMAGGMAYGTVAVWDVANGQPVHMLRGHTLCARNIVFTPCGRRLISISDDYTVRVWTMDKGRLLQSVEFELDSIQDISVEANGVVMVATRSGADVLLWRLPFVANGGDN